MAIISLSNFSSKVCFTSDYFKMSASCAYSIKPVYALVVIFVRKKNNPLVCGRVIENVSIV